MNPPGNRCRRLHPEPEPWSDRWAPASEEAQAAAILPPAPPPAPQEKTPTVAIEIEGFGQKGEGKGACYGSRISPPRVIEPEEWPAALRQWSNSSSSQGVQPAPLPESVPTPHAATEDEVEEWIREDYTPLWNLCVKTVPELEDELLWRTVKKGKKNQPSTKVAHSCGRLVHWDWEGEELFYYLR